MRPEHHPSKRLPQSFSWACTVLGVWSPAYAQQMPTLARTFTWLLSESCSNPVPRLAVRSRPVLDCGGPFVRVRSGHPSWPWVQIRG
jgi:hypothetical protein